MATKCTLCGELIRKPLHQGEFFNISTSRPGFDINLHRHCGIGLAQYILTRLGSATPSNQVQTLALTRALNQALQGMKEVQRLIAAEDKPSGLSGAGLSGAGLSGTGLSGDGLSGDGIPGDGTPRPRRRDDEED